MEMRYYITRTMRENRKMKWMFRSWQCDFTLLKVLSLFIVCCTVKIKASGKITLPITTHASLARAQGPLPWPQLEPLQENYKDKNFPSLMAPTWMPAGRAGPEGQGFPRFSWRFDEDKHSPNKRWENWFKTKVALSFLCFVCFLNAHCGWSSLKFCFTMTGYDPGINFLSPVSQAILLHKFENYWHCGVDRKNSSYKFFRS